jgi:hypothetical protein
MFASSNHTDIPSYVSHAGAKRKKETCLLVLLWMDSKRLLTMNKAQRLKAGETFISREPGNSMTPLIKSRQPVKLAPCKWEDCKKGDIVYCKVNGRYYTHLVKAKDKKRGVLIGNNHGRDNGWTKAVFGKVAEILSMEA